MPAGNRARRVLVVEDEPLIRDLIQDMLVDLGCEVVGPAATISEARHLTNAQQVDLALLDVNIGGQPVFPLAVELAARNIPLAFVTGSGAGSLPPEWRKYPAIGKPFTRDDVESALGLPGGK